MYSSKLIIAFLLCFLQFPISAQTFNTWESGNISTHHAGIYGNKGVGSTSNLPGTRFAALSWQVDDTLWLFGGYGLDANGNQGELNDLWKYNKVNSQWTWVSGSDTNRRKGNYGIQGVSSPTNVPGARNYSITWEDNGSLWLFGGSGIDSTGNSGYLNDLWNFNIQTGQWTWISGRAVRNQVGDYGIVGLGNPTNIPGARYGAISWQSKDTLWLFGGFGYNASSTGRLNDLWKYNKVNGQWTWISGSNLLNQNGSYGTKKVNNSNNVPSSRNNSHAWIEKDTLWLLGGTGKDLNGNVGNLMDLWGYNLISGQWTWVSGTNLRNQQPTYGTLGQRNANNKPGSRSQGAYWQNEKDLWLFGGAGYDENGIYGILNDVWKYSFLYNEWTWMGGTKVFYQQGVFGTQNVGNKNNIPGARNSPVYWTNNNKLWLFGGSGRDGQSSGGYLNDLWSFCISANVSVEPTSKAACVSNDVIFELFAEGEISDYQWQLNSGANWTDLNGENKDTLTLSAITSSMNGNQYRCLINGACGNDTSNVVSLTVYSPPSIGLTSSRNPSVYCYTPYQCSNLKTNATGFGSLSYTWSHGPTVDSIQVCPTAGKWYYISVTDGRGCTTSDSIRQLVQNATSPYPGRCQMCYKFSNGNYYTINLYPNLIQNYLNAGATLGACGSTPNKRQVHNDYSDIGNLFSYYPNPVNNKLSVEWFNIFNEVVNISIIDLTGKVVRTVFNDEVSEGELNNLEIDVSDLGKGMYILRYFSDSNIQMHKIQVVR